MIAIRRRQARVEETADRADDFGNRNGIGLPGFERMLRRASQ